MVTVTTLMRTLRDAHYYWKVGFLGLVLAGIIHIVFFVLFLRLGLYPMVVVNIVSVAIYAYAIFGVGVQTVQSGDDRLMGWLIYIELIGHNLLASWYLSRDAGFAYYLYIPAFLPFFVLTYTAFIYWLRTVFVIVLALWVDISEAFASPKVPIDEASVDMLRHINLFLYLGLLSVLFYLYVVNERDHNMHLKRHGYTDALTGLYNRRYIKELIQSLQIWQQSHSYAIVLIDIDRFKAINDTYGHLCGDRILKAVASEINLHLPKNVVAARWGGDEFLLFFPDTTESDPINTMQALHRRISQMNISCSTKNVRITVTIGGVFAQNNEAFEEALHRADEALYEGKKTGRNRIVFV